METATDELWEHVDALEQGRGFVDRSADRSLIVRGPDARGWLGDLVTADVVTLGRDMSRRSLLLTPTGRIRADIWITQIDGDTFVLSQASDQPEPIVDLLGPYVLSSALSLTFADLPSFFFPGRPEIVFASSADDRRPDRVSGFIAVDEAAFDSWRVGRGDPRMGVDFEAGALPAEAGLERLIDTAKGCFLGQESVAKIRNLGHPPTVLRHRRSDADVAVGTPVRLAGETAGETVGTVTSVAPDRAGGTVLIARVVWRVADAALILDNGSTLFPIRD